MAVAMSGRTINTLHCLDNSLKTPHSVTVLAATLVLTAAFGCQKTPAAQPETTSQAPAVGAAEPAQPPAPKPLPAELPDVLARVNDQPVTKLDFERLIKNIEASNGPIPAERRDEILRRALDQLITYTVMKQEAATRGLSVTDAEVDGQMQQMQKQFPNPADFDKALAARNTTREQLKADARHEMLINKMIEDELATTAAATDGEAKDFYDKNPDKFKQGETVRASHILVMANEKSDEAAKKAARTKIEGILKRVKAGEDFAKLAKENSDDGSKEQGGDLGFFPQGKMVPEFEKAAFSLKPGEISDIVTTQFGYHIIKTTERKEATMVPFDQVKPRLLDFLSNQKKQERGRAFIDEAKKKAKIEVLV
jgi:peptidyl-prolyl cis-trans isomerase C